MNIMNRATRFFASNTFISNARLKLAKNQAKAKQHHEAELLPRHGLLPIDLGLDMETNVLNIKCASAIMVICIKQHLSNI